MRKFEDAALRWLKSEGHEAKTVRSVEPYGSDWEGDTFSGFSSAFNVTIYYEALTGGIRHESVEGEALERFWRFMMHQAFSEPNGNDDTPAA